MGRCTCPSHLAPLLPCPCQQCSGCQKSPGSKPGLKLASPALCMSCSCRRTSKRTGQVAPATDRVPVEGRGQGRRVMGAALTCRGAGLHQAECSAVCARRWFDFPFQELKLPGRLQRMQVGCTTSLQCCTVYCGASPCQMPEQGCVVDSACSFTSGQEWSWLDGHHQA